MAGERRRKPVKTTTVICHGCTRFVQMPVTHDPMQHYRCEECRAPAPPQPEKKEGTT